MRVIVDANIIFSGILNTNGKIGDLLINFRKLITFIAPEFLRSEIRNHYTKISKISSLSRDEIAEVEFYICANINFISEELISKKSWSYAEHLAFDVDEKDTPYLALARELKCKIWSGDKQLIRGLEKKNYLSFINTTQLLEFRENLKSSKQRKRK